MDFANKVVVVTGGGQGIGACIATEYGKKKATVVIAEIDEEAGLEIEAEVNAQGGHGLFVKVDIANEKSVIDMVNQLNKRYGKIDILINNAAISSSGTLFTRTIEEFEKVISVNVTGAYCCAKHCVPLMIGENCSIINMTSTRAMMSEANTEPYSASKGAVLALSHSLAASLSPKIRVNSISPGWIDTSQWKKKSERKFVALREKDHCQHLVGRVGVPEDIAKAVLYLTSEEAGFITGSQIVIDGGMTVKMIYED
ncbi:MAG: glucose 1-dehydrogenase [Cellulosilyticaceae bacterium]